MDRLFLTVFNTKKPCLAVILLAVLLDNLSMVSGSTIEIGAYNPFIIIDGQYYRTEYEPCEELNALGNTLLGTQFARRQIQNNPIQVSAYPVPYTPAMSSSPGIRIDVTCDNFTTARYRAETGTFITWSEDVILNLGSNVIVSNDTPVYWTPMQEPSADDTLTITILRQSDQSATVLTVTSVPITYEGDGWYSVGEGTAPEPPQETAPSEVRDAVSTLYEVFYQIIQKLMETDPALRKR